MLNFIKLFALLALLSSNVFAKENLSNIILVKTSTAAPNVTGDGSTYLPRYDQVIEASGITYDDSTGYFRVSASGIYLATWSLSLSNINSQNTGGAGWVHEGGYGGRGYEPFIYNGNPYLESNAQETPLGKSNTITITGSQVFAIDATFDTTVWIGLKIGGHEEKNITLLENSFFSLKKLA